MVLPQNREEAEGQLLSAPLLFVRHPLNTVEQQLGLILVFNPDQSCYWLQTYELKNAGTEKVILGYRIDVYRIGTRGALGGYSPPLGHASPPSEGENGYFRRFLAFIVP